MQLDIHKLDPKIYIEFKNILKIKDKEKRDQELKKFYGKHFNNIVYIDK